MRRISPELATRYLARSGPYATIVQAIDSGRGLSGSAQVLGIRVDGLRVSKLERRRDVLTDAARRGYDAVVSVLGPVPAARQT